MSGVGSGFSTKCWSGAGPLTFRSGCCGRWQVSIEFPVDIHIAAELLFCQAQADKGDLHGSHAQDLVVKRSIAYLLRIDNLLVERVELKTAEKVASLIQRTISAFEGAPDFGGSIVSLMA